MRTPFAIIVLLVCALLPLALAESEDETAASLKVSVAELTRRVEAIRGLRFETVPVPVEVTAQEAQREGLAVIDRDYPPAQREADADLYELLGLLPADTDMRALYEEIYGSAVGGYYDPEDGRLRVVTGGGTANDVISQITLAHELDHALEDQAIGFDTDLANRTDDPGIAYRSLIEGSATGLMLTYLERHFPPDVALTGLFGSLNGATMPNLPPFINVSLAFPYEAGQTFVDVLYRRGGDSWKLIDEAARTRPPDSTEQIIHPQKWLDRERADRVTPPPAPAGFKRLATGVLGEFQTAQWLRTAGPPAGDVAAGWGGDRYALYGRGEDRVLLLRFAWDTAKDRREFTERLPDALAERGSGAAAFATRDGQVTVAFAPDPAEARELSRQTARTPAVRSRPAR